MSGATDPEPGTALSGGVAGERLTPSFRPRQVEKLPPCQAGCPISGDVRGWVGIVAQRAKTGISDDEAYTLAWQTIANRNPFPSTLGRVCPHPCEAGCNREALDGAVSIHAMERFLGDWAITRELPLPVLETDAKPESIGVIGAGPSGLSFAYQMARRGYPVTVYEQREEPGGMLRFGIPDYRLPPGVVEAEVRRIEALGVRFLLGTTVGTDVTLADLRARHDMLYVGIGAQRGRRLEIPGDDDPAVLNGTDYLACVSRGEQVDVGRAVVVVGGGNTAVDAARTARRAGAECSLVYRRSRAEMPAIAAEVDEALDEGVELVLLAAPLRLERRDDGALVLTCQRVELGAPDASGRRRPVQVPGSEFDLVVDTVITAVSQEPAWEGLDGLGEGAWLHTDEHGAVTTGLWGGGDVLGLGIAGNAIAQGRRAAEALHARLRSLPPPADDDRVSIGSDGVLFDFYPERPRATPRRLSPEDALASPVAEVWEGIDEEQFLAEARRCLSCGLCLGCEQCWMFCTAPSFTRLAQTEPGAYFSLSLEVCRECGKCVDVCPCGYLEMTPAAST